jgi:hypothetical protein
MCMGLQANLKLQLPAAIPVPSAATLPRRLVAPKLSNLSRSSFDLHATEQHEESGVSIGVSKATIGQFSSCPLDAVGLSNFLAYHTSAQDGLAAVNPEIPFAGDQILARAKSRVAVSMWERLEEDCKVFADLENKHASVRSSRCSLAALTCCAQAPRRPWLARFRFA